MTKKRGSHLSKGNRIHTLGLSDIVHTCTPSTRPISGNPWHPKNTNRHLTKYSEKVTTVSDGAEPTVSAVEFRSTSPHPRDLGARISGVSGCRKREGGRLISSIDLYNFMKSSTYLEIQLHSSSTSLSPALMEKTTPSWKTSPQQELSRDSLRYKPPPSHQITNLKPTNNQIPVQTMVENNTSNPPKPPNSKPNPLLQHLRL